MRLGPAMLAGLSPAVGRFDYPRDEQAVGIIHLGLGAFHRAHQATYTDDALNAGDRDWAICGVSLRSSYVRAQLMPQGGLFSVTERAGKSDSTRIIGSVQRVLVATEQAEAVVAAIAAPTTQIVTLTVTEKGYQGSVSGGLALAGAEIGDDLRNPEKPRTIYGFLAAALGARRAAGLPGLTIISCDNLADNGRRLETYLSQFLEVSDPSLRAWFDRECSCPSTMVDRIVPATTNEQIDNLQRQLGFRDEAAVMTEPFTQWVIEDRFVGPRPRWELAGAQLVAEVKPYEDAKLRMLNGAHSALAYLGLQEGHTFVHEAIADPKIRDLVTRLMLDEAAPTLPVTAGLEPSKYAAVLIDRFSNSALAHRLDQIAMDGSQKLPQRWFPTLRIHQREGRQCPAILEALGAWIRYLHPGPRRVIDPMAESLAEIWITKGADQIATALFGVDGLFAKSWKASDAELEILRKRAKTSN